jgi:catechol 2,3-dioxygenase-like lactoylglutathione lyase family enzyme
MPMLSDTITTGAVQHLRLTVSDPARSRDFYVGLLGFLVMFESADGFLVTNGEIFLGLRTAPDPSEAPPADRFSPNRIGLGGLTFSVPSRSELEKALVLCKLRGAECGEIVDRGPAFGFYTLTVFDPDGIQIELSARYPQD